MTQAYRSCHNFQTHVLSNLSENEPTLCQNLKEELYKTSLHRSLTTALSCLSVQQTLMLDALKNGPAHIRMDTRQLKILHVFPLYMYASVHAVHSQYKKYSMSGVELCCVLRDVVLPNICIFLHKVCCNIILKVCTLI